MEGSDEVRSRDELLYSVDRTKLPPMPHTMPHTMPPIEGKQVYTRGHVCATELSTGERFCFLRSVSSLMETLMTKGKEKGSDAFGQTTLKKKLVLLYKGNGYRGMIRD